MTKRKTKLQRNADAALANLLGLIQLAEDNQKVEGGHARNATLIRNKIDADRWLDVIASAGPMPAALRAEVERLGAGWLGTIWYNLGRFR